MMNIKVKDPQFLLATLKEDVVNRVRYLVSQGISYDADWRDAFVELFQVIEQLEIPIGDKLEEYFDSATPTDTYFTEIGIKKVSAKTEEISITTHERKLELKYPRGMSVTIGKGKTIWTVVGYEGLTVHVTREGVGKNNMHVSPDKIKFVKNPFIQNDEEI